MIANHELGTAQRQKRNSNLSSFCLLGMLMFLVLFSTSPCYGQMGSSAIYSDTWLDTSGASSNTVYEEGATVPGAYVVGWGVTQDYNNIYNHSYWVQTTLSGPGGRTASVTSATSSSYTRAEVRLPFTFNSSETGSYSTSSTHMMNARI